MVMGVTKEQVESSLTSKLKLSHLEVIDTSGGCGASFVVEIVSDQFKGKRLLERHRIVNAALEEEMKEIHALSIKKPSPRSSGNYSKRQKNLIGMLRKILQVIQTLK